MAEFFVYEHYRFDIVRIHKGDCVYCRRGSGLKGRGTTRTGRWLPPVQSFAEAAKLALSIGRPDVAACKFCLRGFQVDSMS